MIQQHILLTNGSQEAARFVEAGRDGRKKWRILQIWTIESVQFTNPSHADRTVTCVDEIRR